MKNLTALATAGMEDANLRPLPNGSSYVNTLTSRWRISYEARPFSRRRL